MDVDLKNENILGAPFKTTKTNSLKLFINSSCTSNTPSIVIYEVLCHLLF